MDKRTDINTASFAYSVSLLRIRISGYPPGAGTKRQSIHTAVLHGIAVFFCSTFFTTFHHYFISYDDFCHACASAFMQVLFYLSENGDGCRLTGSAALPAGGLRPSGFSRKFRRNGGSTGEICTQKGIYYKRRRVSGAYI